MEIEAYGIGYPPRFVKEVYETLKEMGIKVPEFTSFFSKFFKKNYYDIFEETRKEIRNYIPIYYPCKDEPPSNASLRRELFMINLKFNKKEARIIKKRSRKDKSYITMEIDGKVYELEFRKIPINKRKIDAYPFNNRVYLILENKIYKSHNKVDVPFKDPSKEEAKVIYVAVGIDEFKEINLLNKEARDAVTDVINRIKEIEKMTGIPYKNIVVQKKWKNLEKNLKKS